MDGMQFDLGPTLVWIAAASSILSFGTMVWGLISSPARRNATRIEAAHARLEDHDLRVARIEQALAAMPSKDDLHGLQVAMESVRGEMREMRAVIEGSNRLIQRLEVTVSRQEDHLLRGSP